MQQVLHYDGSTGIAGVCLSPSSTCAAVIFKSGAAMELQLLDLDSEANEALDTALTANRYLCANVFSCSRQLMLAMSTQGTELLFHVRHQAFLYLSCYVLQIQHGAPLCPAQAVLEPCHTDVVLGCAAAPEEAACQLTRLASSSQPYRQGPALRAIHTSPGIQHAAGCPEATAADKLS